MRVRFFGVRGSVPYATSASIGHGCNTPCIEVFDEAADRLLILDAGSGIVGLGETLGADRRDVPILLTHYHWDHVQGLPFFAPLYRPGGAPTVWAPALGRTFADLETMFEAPFFPLKSAVNIFADPQIVAIIVMVTGRRRTLAPASMASRIP